MLCKVASLRGNIHAPDANRITEGYAHPLFEESAIWKRTGERMEWNMSYFQCPALGETHGADACGAALADEGGGEVDDERGEDGADIAGCAGGTAVGESGSVGVDDGAYMPPDKLPT